MSREKAIYYLRRFRLAFIPVCVGLAAWSFWAAFGSPYRVRPNPVRIEERGKLDVRYGALQPLESYLAPIRQREVFKQSLIYETKKNEVVDILGDFAFLGVVRQGGEIRAFIMNNKSGQSSFYSKGQNLGDLEIQEIQDSKIILHHGSETLELKR